MSKISHGTHCPRLVRALVWTKDDMCHCRLCGWPAILLCKMRGFKLLTQLELLCSVICKLRLLLVWLPENTCTLVVIQT